MKGSRFDVVIIGGGLAGLCNAIHLSKFNKNVLLIEKNDYPKHKVCGEYISNEVLPYLNFLGINPFDYGAVHIDTLKLSTKNNRLVETKLPLGGFGISRYTLDAVLYDKARSQGISLLQDTVTDVTFTNNRFTTRTKTKSVFTSLIAIGAFGKRSFLDVKLQRDFIQKKSNYLAVKMHLKGAFPKHLVALHNFTGGYCGVSNVENETINLCYITNYSEFKKYKTIEDFQENVVLKNKFLNAIFQSTHPVFEQPLTISQISFDFKKPIEQHIIMCGDAAGMIHPLCGNGMSMAIQSAQIASQLILNYSEGKIQSRQQLEKLYISHWNAQFRTRLRAGHMIAIMFRNERVSKFMLHLLQRMPFLLTIIIKNTHGKPIKF